MYKCKQLIIFLSLYVSRLSGATAIIDATVPVGKKPCCVICWWHCCSAAKFCYGVCLMPSPRA